MRCVVPPGSMDGSVRIPTGSTARTPQYIVDPSPELYIQMASTSILLVDDNAVQAGIRQTILRRAGYNVIAVLNPERALEQIRQNQFADPLSLVITDHIMPGMTGAQFTRQLRSLHPSLPVLVVSGLEEAEEEYADLNVVFRLKPLPPDTLLSSVHTLLATANQPATHS